MLLFAVGLFVSDRLIDAFGRHWWIAPFRFGPLMAYFVFVLGRRDAQA